jgi:hypothetical protein
MNIDMNQLVSADEKTALAAVARGAAVKAEAGRRIYAVADQIAQMNLIAAASAGRLGPAQMTTWKSGLQWVDDMRAASASLIADASADHLVDAAWPAVPPGVAELAALF